MGTYKVLQDIEAEDKLLGPLSLRQFVYSIIVVVSLFTVFKLVTSSGGKWYLAIPVLPIIVFFALLAAPFGHDQPNEVWLLGKISFALKPRKRVWNQSGIKELVTITAPVIIEKHLTKELSQTEVQSRLQALANTIDSRGWVIKHTDNPYAHPLLAGSQSASGNRLVDLGQIAQPVEEAEDKHFDVLDYYDNPTIGNVDQLIDDSSQARQQKLESIMRGEQVSSASQPANDPQWFAQQSPASPTPQNIAPVAITNSTQISPQTQSPAVIASNIAVEEAFAKAPAPAPKAKAEPVAASTSQSNAQSTSVTEVDPVIINLANNDDLNISTIARQANKVKVQASDNEVVISLH